MDVLARALATPAGCIADAFSGDDVGREAAYDFVENELVDPRQLRMAAARQTLARAGNEPFVFVAVDGSSASVSDDDKVRLGLGPVGARAQGGRGLLVMSALAISADGVPLGLTSQEYWARAEAKAKKHRNQRTLSEKETRHWFTAIEDTLAARADGHAAKPWFNLDRGGDFREMLASAVDADYFVTVRASWDRRVEESEEKYLWPTLEAVQPLGRYSLEVPAGQKRTARLATMEVRAARVTFRLRDKWSNKLERAPLFAVLTTEVRTAPAEEEKLEWLLITNRPIATFEDACTVIYGYSLRWRIEQFHRVWKETCGVEESQLHSAESLEVWASILAISAARILRLTYLARLCPAAPAANEFSRDEIDATIVMTPKMGAELGDDLTIGEVVYRLGKIGGFTGPVILKAGSRQPGAKLIARGLLKMMVLAESLPEMKRVLTRRDQT